MLNTCQDQSAEPRSEQYWSYKNVLATLPLGDVAPKPQPCRGQNAAGVRDRGEEVLCAERKEKVAVSLFPTGGALCMVDLGSGREM